MNERVSVDGDLRAALEAKDQRIRELERRLAEVEASLQALVSQQIDAVITSEGTIPLLLHQAQQALQRNNEELEQRVAQRTAELTKELAERGRIESSLRESEQIYRAIGESIDYGVWICEPDGRNIYASESFLDLLGITQQQCSDFGWGDNLHPDDAEKTIAAWKECVRTGNTWDREHRFLGKDGQYHAMLARGVPVRDEQGEIIFWAGINLDISRLKQTEQALRRSEAHFQVALKNSPMLVYTTDQDLRYTWIFNPAFGFDPAQIIGKTDEELNPAQDVAELVALKQSVLRSGEGKRQEIQLGFQGEVYTFDVTAEPIRGDHGEVAGLTVAAIDVTEAKHLEQARLKDKVQIELQRKLMEHREKERQQIARDIHDGPIQTLVSAIFQLQNAQEDLTDQAQKLEFYQIGLSIKFAVQELRQVINELRPPSLLRFGLPKAIRFHAEELQEKADGLNIHLEIPVNDRKLPEESSLTLFRIYQEAMNNIIRHAGAKSVVIRLDYQEEHTILEIEDDGKGFAQALDPTAQTANGHYGLAGMEERAEAAGGQFQIQSLPGKGTTIKVRIPTGS